MAGVASPPPAAIAGDSFTIDGVMTLNLGSAPAASSKIRFYPSDNTTRSANDKLLPDQVTVPALNADDNDVQSDVVLHIPANTLLLIRSTTMLWS